MPEPIPDLDRCRRLGGRAFERGENTSGCPHHWTDAERAAWIDGWRDAMRDYRDGDAGAEQLEDQAQANLLGVRIQRGRLDWIT